MPFVTRVRPGSRTALALATLLVAASLAGCAQTDPQPEDPQAVLDDAIAAFKQAGRGSYAVATMTDGAEDVRVEGAWQLTPARHRSTTIVQESGDGAEVVQSTLVENAETRWTLPPEFHDRDTCWTRGPASQLTAGVPGVLRLLLEGQDARWSDSETTLTAQGPASAAIGSLGELGDLLPEVSDDVRVEFTVLLDGGRATALRTDLGAALEAVETAGVTLPDQLEPFTSEALEVSFLASFSDLGEDVDTEPPAAGKIRDC